MLGLFLDEIDSIFHAQPHTFLYYCTFFAEVTFQSQSVACPLFFYATMNKTGRLLFQYNSEKKRLMLQCLKIGKCAFSLISVFYANYTN